MFWKFSKNMFYKEIRIKQGLTYISFCSLMILYNSKFILKTVGTNAVIVTRGHYFPKHSDKQAWANGVDQYRKTHNVAPVQGERCLSLIQ